MNRDDDLVVPGMLVHHEVEKALDEYRDDLRTKVTALHDEAGRNEFASLEANYVDAAYEYQAQREVLEKVLRLIGGNDGPS